MAYKKSGDDIDRNYARITWRKPRELRTKHVAGRFLLRCACCDQKVEIYPDTGDGFLEVNGVIVHRSQLTEIIGENNSGVRFVCETSADDCRVPIRPQDISLDSVNGKFGNREVDIVAEGLLRFFQEKNYWTDFSDASLQEFSVRNGICIDRVLFGLFGYWVDDGALGTIRTPAPYIVMFSGRRMCITNRFLDKLTERQ